MTTPDGMKYKLPLLLFTLKATAELAIGHALKVPAHAYKWQLNYDHRQL